MEKRVSSLDKFMSAVPLVVFGNQCGEQFCMLLLLLNPLTSLSDQDRISPYNINTILNRKVMRIKKNINLGIIC